MTTTKKFLSLEELKETRQWIGLTEQRRKLVETYITNGFDKQAAVKAAYNITTERSLTRTTAFLFAAPAITETLAVFFQDDPLTPFREEIRRELRRHKLTPQRVALFRLAAQVHGIVDVTAQPEGTVVAEKEFEKDGRKFRTTVTDLGPAEKS